MQTYTYNTLEYSARYTLGINHEKVDVTVGEGSGQTFSPADLNEFIDNLRRARDACIALQNLHEYCTQDTEF